MNQKIIFIVSVLLILISCNRTNDKSSTKQQSNEEFKVEITSSDLKRLNEVDLPFDCEASRAHLIDRLLSPSILSFFLNGLMVSLI